jgi:putative ABC transport system permease protein
MSVFPSIRSLSRRPWLAVTIILTLALGIGATTAIFSIADAVLLKPLPLKAPDRLIVIQESKRGRPSNGNPARLEDWRTQVPGLESAAGFYTERVVLTGRGDAERISALRSFGPILSVLGIEPRTGRASTNDEVLLSDEFWRRRFGGESILGQTLDLDGKPYTIAGILPPEAAYPERVDVFVPASIELQHASRKASFLPTIARMKPGARLAEVQAQIATVADRLRRLYPATDGDLSARAIPLLESDTTEARLPVLALLGAVGLVFLTACINVAGLLLARASERRKETSIRVSLGATRFDLIRLYLNESLILSACGCAVGLALAAFAIDGMKAILPTDLPRLSSATLDWRVMTFATGVSLLCAMIFGIVPAWQAARRPKLRDTNAFPLRRAMVAAQVALSVILLVAAGLLGESFLKMRRAPLGFQPANVLTVNISFPWDAPDTRVQQFRTQALENFAAIPGVISAGWGDRLPFNGGTQSGPIAIRNRDLPPALREQETYHRAASDTYFQAIGIPLLSGRLFREGKPEAVINQTLANKFFPEGGAIGQYLTFDTKPKPNRAPQWIEIVGIVGDVRQNSTDLLPPAEAYLPGSQLSWPLSSFVLRVQGEPNAMIGSVREAVRRIDPNQVIDSTSAMNNVLDANLREPRLQWWLVMGFALTALGLTVLGIYGVLSSDIVQRRREIGIRIAVGAEPRRVLRMMIRRGLWTVVPGIAIGLAGAAALTRFVAGLLFGVSPFDGVVFAAVALTLAVTGLIASYFPARRAASIDPVEALRD